MASLPPLPLHLAHLADRAHDYQQVRSQALDRLQDAGPSGQRDRELDAILDLQFIELYGPGSPDYIEFWRWRGVECNLTLRYGLAQRCKLQSLDGLQLRQKGFPVPDLSEASYFVVLLTGVMAARLLNDDRAEESLLAGMVQVTHDAFQMIAGQVGHYVPAGQEQILEEVKPRIASA